MRKQERLRQRLVVAALATLTLGTAALALAIGDVELVLTRPPGERPEGIAFTRLGRMYYGTRAATPTGLDSTLRTVSPDGSTDTAVTTFARSPGSALLGLAVDDEGVVWAAVHAGPDHGVWRIAADGSSKERVAGSTAMSFPNGLTFDARGNLYVTDSGPISTPVGGSIWRLAKGASTIEKWAEHPLLAPLDANPFGFDLQGANGIVFSPPSSLYVANTERGQVVHVPIRSNGDAGTPTAVTPFFAVPTADGLTVDVHGMLYVAIPGHTLLPGPPPPVVMVDPSTGAVSRVSAAEFDGEFDFPLSLAFGTRHGDTRLLYVTNGDIPLTNAGPGPRIVRIRTEDKGMPVK